MDVVPLGGALLLLSSRSGVIIDPAVIDGRDASPSGLKISRNGIIVLDQRSPGSSAGTPVVTRTSVNLAR